MHGERSGSFVSAIVWSIAAAEGVFCRRGATLFAFVFAGAKTRLGFQRKVDLRKKQHILGVAQVYT